MARRKSLFAAIAILIIVLLAIVISGCGNNEKSSKKPVKSKNAKFYPKTKPSAVAGEKIFSKKCATCHGATGRGDGPLVDTLDEKPKNFTDTGFMRREEPQEFYEAITEGKESMPKFKKRLTEQERWDVLFYVWSLGTSSEQLKEGQTVYKKYCEACHGSMGDSKGVASKALKKKPKKLNDPKFMMRENGNEFYEKVTDGDKPMPSFKKKLTVAQRRSVIDYAWTFVYEPVAQE